MSEREAARMLERMRATEEDEEVEPDADEAVEDESLEDEGEEDQDWWP